MEYTKEYLDAKHVVDNSEEYNIKLVSEARTFINGYENAYNLKDKVIIKEAVPYQLCPKCNGVGYVASNITNVNSVLSTGITTCDLCNGNKIIPMHVLVFNELNIPE